MTYLNVVAEGMTGWSRQDAAGRSLEEVFRIVDAVTRESTQDPDGVGRPGKQDRKPHAELRLDQAGRSRSRDRRFRRTHPRPPRTSDWRGHGVSRREQGAVLLNDRMTQAIARAQRDQQELAVLFLDVDRFKHINDSLGHDVGDRLLQSVAQRLLACVRGTDTVSRRGGDEFVIVFSEVKHARDAAVSAAKILITLSKPYPIDQHELHLTVSIGIVTYPDDGTDVGTLMKNADVAMYHAKNSGRKTYQFFKADMNVRAAERHSIESVLRSPLSGTNLCCITSRK